MFLVIEENDNCRGEERVFSESSAHKTVAQVQLEKPDGNLAWCDVASVDENGAFGQAKAVQVEDSSDGVAWLVFGGMWGLRFRTNQKEWSLQDKDQWGEPFKVLDISATDIKFQ